MKAECKTIVCEGNCKNHCLTHVHILYKMELKLYDFKCKTSSLKMVTRIILWNPYDAYSDRINLQALLLNTGTQKQLLDILYFSSTSLMFCIYVSYTDLLKFYVYNTLYILNNLILLISIF